MIGKSERLDQPGTPAIGIGGKTKDEILNRYNSEGAFFTWLNLKRLMKRFGKDAKMSDVIKAIKTQKPADRK